ncbi:MAG: YqjK-like family protein [Rhodocyclaceae bacterium]|nr:YqjK-like family protein [Rhodocyclaceae bacterium]
MPVREREIELALRRERLCWTAAAQREALSRHLEALQPLLNGADRIIAAAVWVKRRPELIVGLLALLAMSSRKTRAFLWRWGKRGFFFWQLLHSQRAQWSGIWRER